MSQAQHMTVARRYAKAHLSLVLEKKKEKALEGDIATLKSAIETSGDFNRFLNLPSISLDARLNALHALAKTLKLGGLTVSLLGVLAENKRLQILPTLCLALEEALSAHRGEISATVTSASALSKVQEKNVVDALKKAAGTDVKVDFAVDETLIGGLVIKLGSLQIDQSVKTRLDQLTRALKSGDVALGGEGLKKAA